MSSAVMSIDAFDRLLSDRLADKGIIYENLIGVFEDVPPCPWFRPRNPNDLRGIAFHHTAGSPRQSTSDIYQSHKNNFRGIGYHFLAYCYPSQGGIYRKLRMVRDPMETGAHVKNANHLWIGYSWPGTYHEQAPNEHLLSSQAEMFSVVLRTLQDWTGINLEVVTHRQAMAIQGQPNYTQCPDGNTDWFDAEFRSLIDTTEPEPTDCSRAWNAGLHRAGEVFQHHINEAMSKAFDDLRELQR